MAEKTLPITPDVLEAWEELEKTDSPEDRQAIVIQLAEIYSQYHDSTNPDLPNNFTEAVDKFDLARIAYGQAATSLGMAITKALRASMATTEQKANSH